MAFFSVKDLQVYYGAIHAIKGISFEVHRGEIVTLIGANGAGKTTTMHAISGLLKPKNGEIVFDGSNLEKLSAHKIPGLGLVQVPEGRRVFANMSVMENLEMGAFKRKDQKHIDDDLDMVFAHLPRLKERRRQMAGTLSGGEQQMLAVGRAMMRMPRLLMLDEPSLGLAPLIIREIFSMIERIHQMGTTILLVEQNARMALSVCDYAYVMENGSIAMQGKGSDLLHDPKVSAAYLGGI